jgi:hypothetical protein
VRQLPLVVLIISICVYVAPAATDTRKKVSIVAGAGIAVEYAATEIGGHTYICPIRSVSMLRAHTAQQSGAFSRSNYKGAAKTFLNEVTFSNYRRFGSKAKILTSSPED